MRGRPSHPLPSPRRSLLCHHRSKPDSSMSTDHPNRGSSCCHALVLLGATGVVVLGTALVGPCRLWLFVVTVVVCGAAYWGGALVDGASRGLLAGGHFASMRALVVRLGALSWCFFV